MGFRICLGDLGSKRNIILRGAPQGHISSRFNLHSFPLGQPIKRHNMCYHHNADDTQLYVSLPPDDLSPIDTLFECIKDINKCISSIFYS